MHPRLCSAAALASAGVHVWMAGQHSGFGAAAMVAMALMCLPCVLPLWRSGSLGAARMLMGGALAMVAVHAVLLLAPGGGGAGHQHGGAVAVSAAGGGSEATFGMLALIGWELCAALLAATWLRRRAVIDVAATARPVRGRNGAAGTGPLLMG